MDYRIIGLETFVVYEEQTDAFDELFMISLAQRKRNVETSLKVQRGGIMKLTARQELLDHLCLCNSKRLKDWCIPLPEN